jgi:uncharacterized membrane protein
MENRNSRRYGRNGYVSRFTQLEPWASYVGGGALTAFGISRKSWGGAALAAAGGLLIYRAATYNGQPHNIHVLKSVTIMKPVAEVYAFWRNFENLPRIMTHLESVSVTDKRYSHWIARGPAKTRVEWDAEILEDRENEFLVWRSCAGADIENRGSVQFSSALNGEATELIVAIDYSPPAGRVGATFAKLFGEEPEQQVREDLRHFKALLETGEVPTIEGQPSGRRSAFVRMMQNAYAEPKKRPETVSASTPAHEMA